MILFNISVRKPPHLSAVFEIWSVFKDRSSYLDIFVRVGNLRFYSIRFLSSVGLVGHWVLDSPSCSLVNDIICTFVYVF